MSNIILCNVSDASNIIEEERAFWITEIMDYLEIPDEVYEADNIDMYRSAMNDLGIDIDLSTNGTVNVYKKEWFVGGNGDEGWLLPTKNHLVAQWKQPNTMKYIEGKNIYCEIHLQEWSVFNKR